MEKAKRTKRISYSRIPQILEYPNLMDIQLKFFRDFIQEEKAPSERAAEGLQAVFESVFPITDSRGNYELQFVAEIFRPGMPGERRNLCRSFKGKNASGYQGCNR